MRILVTGAGGFVGRWLVADLEAAGHEVIAHRHADLDVTDAASVRDAVTSSGPQAICHLAGIAFPPEANRDAAATLAVAVDGITAVTEAVRGAPDPPALLVAGSSEVYRLPMPSDEPLTESAPLGPRTSYGRAKLAQEGIALAFAARDRARVVVTRSFNHSGPGQRADYVLPALAARISAARLDPAPAIRVGNIDVARDITDVRDVVRAYRLLVEGMVDGAVAAGGIVVNVASGRAHRLRDLLGELCRLAGVEPDIVVDRELVRADDPPVIRGSAAFLRSLTGWEPRIPIEQTLADLWSEAVNPPAPNLAATVTADPSR